MRLHMPGSVPISGFVPQFDQNQQNLFDAMLEKLKQTFTLVKFEVTAQNCNVAENKPFQRMRSLL